MLTLPIFTPHMYYTIILTVTTTLIWIPIRLILSWQKILLTWYWVLIFNLSMLSMTASLFFLLLFVESVSRIGVVKDGLDFFYFVINN